MASLPRFGRLEKAYIPFIPGNGTSVGPSGAASLELSAKIDGSYTGHSKTITLSKDCTLEPGKMYRVNVSME